MNNEANKKSMPSDENKSHTISEQEKGRSINTAEGQKKISLNDFLDLLKVSCHVNDMIAMNCQQKKRDATKIDLDFKKLADNSLVNELLGHRKAKIRQDSQIVENGGSTSGNLERVRSRRRSSTIASTSHAAMTPDNSRYVGLHPKLHEKLDYVINEGVLDSVLPFICPVPVPNVFPPRAKDRRALNYKGTPIEVIEKEINYMLSENSTTTTKRKTSIGSKTKDRKEQDVLIHVCDEVKNASKDFTCPQSLLVSKMGYFADVTAGQKLEDMDISVHCDIQIFEWLMKWIKSSAHNESLLHTSSATMAGPQLDATNVVPILVSASFLQMEPLLLECLSYCHSHLTEIVRAPTNFSCLNDALITRLSAMFTNLELEMVRDKKERVTPRLWTKLIQSLCEPEPEALRGHYYSLSGLFRCSKCGKCLTNTMKSYIPCLSCNLRLNRWGQMVSHHVRDSSWDINMFIVQLFKELKSWRRVYWRLWGYCHFLYCCICETHFPAYQMPWCRYHPENPHYLGPMAEGRMAGPAGRYPCCGQQAFRYDTLPGPNGCQFREHSVLVETDRERAILAIVQYVGESGYALFENPPDHFRQVLANGESIEPRWVGLSLVPQHCRQGLLPMLNPDEPTNRIARRARQGCAYFRETSTDSDTSDTYDSNRRERTYTNEAHQNASTCSDGCESDCSSPKFVKSKSGKKRQTNVAGRYWSGELSARSNQDHQREFEEKVMKQVVSIVSKRSITDNKITQNTVPLGGSYIKLEAEWREMIKQRGNTNSNISSASTSTTTISKLRNK